MTDSTSHNLEVIESVCKEDDIKAPKALTCNIHPLMMMMQRKVKEVFHLIHNTIGSDKVNKDYSAKTWNRQSHFDNFNKPCKTCLLR